MGPIRVTKERMKINGLTELGVRNVAFLEVTHSDARAHVATVDGEQTRARRQRFRVRYA